MFKFKFKKNDNKENINSRPLKNGYVFLPDDFSTSFYKIEKDVLSDFDKFDGLNEFYNFYNDFILIKSKEKVLTFKEDSIITKNLNKIFYFIVQKYKEANCGIHIVWVYDKMKNNLDDVQTIYIFFDNEFVPKHSEIMVKFT